MTFQVPATKDGPFTMQFFQILSDNLLELKIEAGKWPDRIAFSGNLGKELYEFIAEKGWDLKQFNLTLVASPVDKIIFEYSKPLTQIEDKGATIFDESFNGRKVNGIAGADVMQKILTAYSAPAFKIERTIRPKLEVILTRKK